MSRALSGCVHMVEAAEARRVFESAAGGVPIPDVAPRGLSVGSAPAARGGGRGLFAEAAFAPGDELLRDVLLAATVESPGASEPVVVFSRREGAWVAQYACAQELVPRVGRVAATVRMNSVHTPHGLFQAVMGRWASYVNHDCAPNAVALWTPGVGLVLRALLHIEPGEEVTRCYGRRESLPDIYGFVCACGLCTDREASVIGPRVTLSARWTYTRSRVEGLLACVTALTTPPLRLEVDSALAIVRAEAVLLFLETLFQNGFRDTSAAQSAAAVWHVNAALVTAVFGVSSREALRGGRLWVGMIIGAAPRLPDCVCSAPRPLGAITGECLSWKIGVCARGAACLYAHTGRHRREAPPV